MRLQNKTNNRDSFTYSLDFLSLQPHSEIFPKTTECGVLDL